MRVRGGLLTALFFCGLATNPAGQGASAVPALVNPTGLALDTDGTLYISDSGTHQILKVARGRLTAVAGTGDGGFGGDGGPAARAQLFAPNGIALDAEGGLLVADTYNHRVRRIDRRGVITTIAGTGTAASTGDGGPATAATLNGPQDVAIDRAGNIFVADTYNALVRRIDRAGVITTFAGSEPGLAATAGRRRARCSTCRRRSPSVRTGRFTSTMRGTAVSAGSRRTARLPPLSARALDPGWAAPVTPATAAPRTRARRSPRWGCSSTPRGTCTSPTAATVACAWCAAV